MSIINLGNDQRKRLRVEDKYTIRIKELFPNFQTYERVLNEWGVQQDDILESDFKLLLMFGGSIFVKWMTYEEARVRFARKFITERWRYNQYKKLYDLSIEQIMEDKSVVDSFTTNENDDFSNRKYLSQSQETINTASKLANYEILKIYLDGYQDPQTKFINDLISFMAVELQPHRKTMGTERRNEIDNG